MYTKFVLDISLPDLLARIQSRKNGRRISCEAKERSRERKMILLEDVSRELLNQVDRSKFLASFFGPQIDIGGIFKIQRTGVVFHFLTSNLIYANPFFSNYSFPSQSSQTFLLIYLNNFQFIFSLFRF